MRAPSCCARRAEPHHCRPPLVARRASHVGRQPSACALSAAAAGTCACAGSARAGRPRRALAHSGAPCSGSCRGPRASSTIPRSSPSGPKPASSESPRSSERDMRGSLVSLGMYPRPSSASAARAARAGTALARVPLTSGTASESAISVEMLGARPREAARTTSSTCVGESVMVIERDSLSDIRSCSHMQTTVCIASF